MIQRMSFEKYASPARSKPRLNCTTSLSTSPSFSGGVRLYGGEAHPIINADPKATTDRTHRQAFRMAILYSATAGIARDTLRGILTVKTLCYLMSLLVLTSLPGAALAQSTALTIHEASL